MAGRAGFTLVELMVAVCLMVIMTGSIVFIFTVSQKTVTEADRAATILQNVRNCFDVFERDLSTAAKTHDMEFFKEKTQEGRPLGHFDPDEELVGLHFNFPGMDDVTRKYSCSMTIIGSKYTEPDELKKRPTIPLRNDVLYFRGVTLVEGEHKPCLIAFMLAPGPEVFEVLPDIGDLSPRFPRHPTLKKYVLYQRKDGSYKMKKEDICCYVQSFKVEYYFDFLEDKHPPMWWGPAPGKVKEFAYRGTGFLDMRGNLIVKVRKPGGKQGFNPRCSPPPDEINPRRHSDFFSQVGSGDRIFLFGGNPITRWNVSYNRDFVISGIDRTTRPPKLTFDTADIPPKGIQRVSFRAGYLPPAIRITIQAVDEDRKQVRTFKRIFPLKSE